MIAWLLLFLVPFLAFFYDKDDSGGGGDTSEEDDAPAPAPDDTDEAPDENEEDDTPESDLLKSIKADPKRTEEELLALRKESRERLEKLRAAEKEQETQRRKDLEKREEFKTLYEEATDTLETTQARVTELEAELESYRDADAARVTERSKTLPRHIVAVVERMEPRDALAYLDEYADELAPPDAPDFDAGAGGDRKKKKLEPAYKPRVKL